MNRRYSPFLWSFQKDEGKMKHATSGEDVATASVNEEMKTKLVEILYNSHQQYL